MTEMPRDRLRELLDAVLDDQAGDRDEMARRAYSSPYHFSREFRRGTYESPVALRRRVILERAGWRLRNGEQVTEVALTEGYESVEGFSRAYSRAFGHPPSAARAHPQRWLEAPNGIHFHPPTSLWVDSTRTSSKENPVMSQHPTALLTSHDVDDTRALLELAGKVATKDYDRTLMPRHEVLGWDGPEESIAALLEKLIWTKEVWLAAIDGADLPTRGGRDLGSLMTRHEAVAPRWLTAVQRFEDEGRWGDVLIDALCDPPESFVIGSVVSHVLTYSAYRRQVIRQLLRSVGVAADHGDPIMWLRDRAQANNGRNDS